MSDAKEGSKFTSYSGVQVVYPDPKDETIARLSTQLAAANAECEQLRGEVADKERQIEFWKDRDGMTAARNYFCAEINKIGRLYWGDNKDHYAPDAIVREATKRDAELTALRTAHEADREAMREAKEACEAIVAYVGGGYTFHDAVKLCRAALVALAAREGV